RRPRRAPTLGEALGVARGHGAGRARAPFRARRRDALARHRQEVRRDVRSRSNRRSVAVSRVELPILTPLSVHVTRVTVFVTKSLVSPGFPVPSDAAPTRHGRRSIALRARVTE